MVLPLTGIVEVSLAFRLTLGKFHIDQLPPPCGHILAGLYDTVDMTKLLSGHCT